MIKLHKVQVSNYLVVIVLAVTTILSTPLYYRHLGAEEWGGVAIAISVQAFLGLLDLGMVQLIPRDVAMYTDPRLRHEIYRQYLFNYLAIPIVLAAVAGVAWVAHPLPVALAQGAFKYGLCGAVLYVLQSLNLAHYAFLNGLGLQILANRMQSGNAILRVLGLLLVVVMVPANALLFLAVTAAFYCTELAINMSVAHARFKEKARANVNALSRGLLRYVGQNWKMMLGVSIGLLVSNIDRIMLLPKVDRASFGVYVLVLGFALNAMNLQYPLFKNLLADAFALAVPDLRARSVNIFKLNLMICVLPCMIAAALARPILQVWSRDVGLAQQGAPVFAIVLLAVAVNSLHHLNYLKQIFCNAQDWIAATHVASLAACLVYLSSVHDLAIVDGAIAWLLSNVIQFSGGLIWSTRRYARPISFSW